MGFLLELGVPLKVAAPLDELTEEVRERFRLCSSAAAVRPLFRVPGFGMS